jgi:hypothetical protein
MTSHFGGALLLLMVAAIVMALVMVDAVRTLAHVWGDDGRGIEFAEVRMDTEVVVSLGGVSTGVRCRGRLTGAVHDGRMTTTKSGTGGRHWLTQEAQPGGWASCVLSWRNRAAPGLRRRRRT